jgi:hypothetical protein
MHATNNKPLAAVAVLAAVVALGACGGGSSKPAYCSARGDLEQSIKDLGNVKVAQQGGAQKLKDQLGTIESNANKVVSSAKGDFPSETSSIQSSVSSLKTTLQKLPSSPSASQVAAVATSAKGLASSVQSFVKATDSKCA